MLPNNVDVDSNFVSKWEAEEFAKNRVALNNRYAEKKMRKNSGGYSEVNEILEVIEVGDQKTTFYVINYVDSGS